MLEITGLIIPNKINLTERKEKAMKHRKIISALLAFAMVFNMLTGSILPAFATGTDNTEETGETATTYTVTFDTSYESTSYIPGTPRDMPVEAGAKIDKSQVTPLMTLRGFDEYAMV